MAEKPGGAKKEDADNPNPSNVKNPKPQPDDYLAIANQRRSLGYALAGGAIVGFIALVVWLVFWGLPEIKPVPVADGTALQVPVFIAYVSGHVAITVACAYFLYQLLRAGERLSLPHWWIDKAIEKDGAILHAMLGVRTPAAEVEAALTAVGRLAEVAKGKHEKPGEE
jgi:hypothetical protein